MVPLASTARRAPRLHAALARNGRRANAALHRPAAAIAIRHAGIGAASRRAYSTFEPPPNNTYHGTPVYDNVDLASPAISEAAAARNADAEAVFVVTGASEPPSFIFSTHSYSPQRSMGLQFVKELMARTKGRIVACVLRPGSAPALDSYLNGLSPDERDRIEVHRLDVTNAGQIEQLADDLTKSHGRVDGLFNVAGSLGDKTNTPGPEMNLSQLDQSWAEQQMAVNAIGPMMLTSKLAPLLKARKGRKNYLRESGARESVVVNLSARAALNAGVRASAHELRRQGTWQLLLYPGMTDTDMSKPFQSKQMVEKGLVFPVEFTVGRLLDVVDRMEEENSGGFYDWAGQAIPF
ncbi:hypothetical protein ACHAXT_001932 [Thalassiosira profunda]